MPFQEAEVEAEVGENLILKQREIGIFRTDSMLLELEVRADDDLRCLQHDATSDPAVRSGGGHFATGAEHGRRRVRGRGGAVRFP